MAKVNYLDRAAMLAQDQLERLNAYHEAHPDRTYDENVASFFRKTSEAKTTEQILHYLVNGMERPILHFPVQKV